MKCLRRWLEQCVSANVKLCTRDYVGGFSNGELFRTSKLSAMMPREQVRTVLGKPTRIWNDEEAEDPYEAWEYNCGTYRKKKVLFTVAFYRSGASRSWWGFGQ